MTDDLAKQPNSRMCFLCGVENPTGLRLAIYEDRAAGRVVSTVSVAPRFQGYPGVVHGGIVATLLDEVAGRATLIGDPDGLMVTVTLAIRYRQPTPTEIPLTVTGWLVNPPWGGATSVRSTASGLWPQTPAPSASSRSRARARGEIRLPDGTVTAEADLTLVRPPAEFDARWAPERPFWKVYPD